MLRRSLTTFLLSMLAIATLTATAGAQSKELAVATFGAGCYWCVEADFDKVNGVLETTPGFMGGKTENPTYEEVSSGATGHTEVVNITFDPAVVSYEKLLDYYWRHVDLLDAGGQFCDRGSQYRPAIFYHDAVQKTLAENSKKAIDDSKRFHKPVIVEINAQSAFTPAPDPDYYKLNPLKYKFYRAGCGRDARIKQLWGSEASH